MTTRTQHPSQIDNPAEANRAETGERLKCALWVAGLPVLFAIYLVATAIIGGALV